MPVQGAVTVNGKPLKGGHVRFTALNHDRKTCQPEGLIDTQGHYSVAVYRHEGAPVGKYRVTVDPASDDKKMDAIVDFRYLNPEKTPLTVTVQENAPAGAYDLKLKASPKRR
jgi:hypothetical protein